MSCNNVIQCETSWTLFFFKQRFKLEHDLRALASNHMRKKILRFKQHVSKQSWNEDKKNE